MSDRPPFDVVMRGPEAVALWFEQKDSTDKRRVTQLHSDLMTILGTLRIGSGDRPSVERIGIAMAACAQVAVIIMYALQGAMRGPARDELSELIDAAFDTIDDDKIPPELRAVVEQLRRAK